MSIAHYYLRCQSCGSIFHDDGLILECPDKHPPALLVTEYRDTNITWNTHAAGIYRYHQWLPIWRELAGTTKTVVYQSKRLSKVLGLPNLWIAFNGYWPERGANFETATFKELEAYTVLSRFPQNQQHVLVVSSAGNTAAAFAYVCSRNKIPCLIIVPESGLSRIQFRDELDPCVKIVSLVGFVDYHDAIALANRIAQRPSFVLEGGVKNVGRRDGLGIVMLSAVETIGNLPDYYFQAVGSGAGGIAVHEVAQRFLAGGHFGHRFPRLMLSQNLPFAPMYYAWKQQQRELITLHRDEGKRQIQQIAAHVLSNQHPPYASVGGVFDVLTKSHGEMLAATNQEVSKACHLFEECEGIDLDPAAGVALATLLQTVSNRQIDHHATVLLNITGGGWQKRETDHCLRPAQPALQVLEQAMQTDKVIDDIIELFDIRNYTGKTRENEKGIILKDHITEQEASENRCTITTHDTGARFC